MKQGGTTSEKKKAKSISHLMTMLCTTAICFVTFLLCNGNVYCESKWEWKNLMSNSRNSVDKVFFKEQGITIARYKEARFGHPKCGGCGTVGSGGWWPGGGATQI